jgi:hypothetical protein
MFLRVVRREEKRNAYIAKGEIVRLTCNRQLGGNFHVTYFDLIYFFSQKKLKAN